MLINENVNKIDITKLTCFKSCPRMFLYKHILGWNREIFDTFHLSFGIAFHEAIGACLTDKDPVQTFIEVFQREGYHSEESKDGKNLANVKRAIELFLDYCKTRPFKLLKLEQGGLSPIQEDPPLFLYYNFDILGEREGKVEVFEIKTSSRAMNSAIFESSDQITNYFNAVSAQLGTLTSQVNVLNFVFLKNDVSLNLMSFNRTAGQVLQFLEETAYLLYHLHNYIEDVANSSASSCLNPFYRCSARCFDYFHECEYTELCQAYRTKDLFRMIQNNITPVGFQKSFWNPEKHEVEIC